MTCFVQTVYIRPSKSAREPSDTWKCWRGMNDDGYDVISKIQSLLLHYILKMVVMDEIIFLPFPLWEMNLLHSACENLFPPRNADKKRLMNGEHAEYSLKDNFCRLLPPPELYTKSYLLFFSSLFPLGSASALVMNGRGLQSTTCYPCFQLYVDMSYRFPLTSWALLPVRGRHRSGLALCWYPRRPDTPWALGALWAWRHTARTPCSCLMILSANNEPRSPLLTPPQLATRQPPWRECTRAVSCCFGWLVVSWFGAADPRARRLKKRREWWWRSSDDASVHFNTHQLSLKHYQLKRRSEKQIVKYVFDRDFSCNFKTIGSRFLWT